MEESRFYLYIIRAYIIRYNKQVLYHSETWDLMARRWGKLEKDFLPKTGVFDISKVCKCQLRRKDSADLLFQIPDIYDCIKYDVEHNRAVLENTDAWKVVVELYTNVQVEEMCRI